MVRRAGTSSRVWGQGAWRAWASCAALRPGGAASCAGGAAFCAGGAESCAGSAASLVPVCLIARASLPRWLLGGTPATVHPCPSDGLG